MACLVWTGGCEQMTGDGFEVPPPAAGARRGQGLVEFGQGLADVVVRQAVDVGVEPWGHNQVDPEHQLVEVEGAGGVRPGVHEDGGGVEDGHQRQVGSAGGEGLVVAGPSWNAQHRGHDVGIGDHGHWQEGREHSQGCHEVQHFDGDGAGAAEPQQG